MFAVRGLDRAPDAPVAFLVHGAQCNKSMMLQLAKYLALSGVDSYAIDLPGHGASPEPYRDERAAPVAAEALEFLVRHEGLRKDRIVLVGHSYGATVLGRVALADPSYAAAVFLGPASAPGLTPDVPRNLLVLTAEHDYDFIVSAARSIVADSTGGALSSPGSWSGGAGRARAWHIAGGLGHVSLILSERAFREVLGWIESATGQVARPDEHPTTGESVALILLVPALLAAPFLLWSAPLPARPARPKLRPYLILGVAWFAALLGIRYAIPLQFLRLREGEVLASLMLMAGALALGLDAALCRGAQWPRPRSAVRAVPAALAAVAVLYLCGALLVERELYRVAISPQRGGLVVVLAVALFPILAYCEALFPPRGAGRALAVGCVYGVAALSLGMLGARLERFGPALFVLGAACAALGSVLVRVTRNAAASPVLAALVAGWSIAVGFMRY
jgi:pimeloyl-ACP methyl ester carboxylesterase